MELARHMKQRSKEAVEAKKYTKIWASVRVSKMGQIRPIFIKTMMSAD